jgi:hypothetical protein
MPEYGIGTRPYNLRTGKCEDWQMWEPAIAGDPAIAGQVGASTLSPLKRLPQGVVFPQNRA